MPEAEDKEQEQWSLVWYTLICAMKGAICRKNIIYWWPKGKLRKLGVFLSASVAFQGRGKLHSIIWGTGSRLKNTQILCPPLAASLQAELNSFQEMESFEGVVSTKLQRAFQVQLFMEEKSLSTTNHSECALRTSCWNKPGIDSGRVAIHYHDTHFKIS